MPKRLVITGLVKGTINKKPVRLGAGTDVTSVVLPDKKYGLTTEDVDRIVRAKAGYIEDGVSKETTADPNGDGE